MFQKYKYVLAVYREQSFTAAAAKLFISQPSLSVAIRNIEKELGAPLFERSGSGVRLTEIGKAYIAAARKMQLAEDEFEKKCLDINELQTGTLVVGCSNYLASYVLPKIITLFRSRFPNVEITLVEANSIRLREMLHNEEVDMIIDNLEDEESVCEKYPLAKEQIFLCVPADRAINRELVQYQLLPEVIYDGTAVDVPAVQLSSFAKESFILLKQGNDMHRRAMEIFAENNLDADVIFQVDQLNISYALAESGVGCCFVTDTLFKYKQHAENVILYCLDTTRANRMLYVVHNKNKYCTRAMAEFIKTAQEIIKS
ncbi:MAG: LysR family transcriptional regulator [Oscillospiraceae bacterium]|nr:LysR family transcriptional regulator [Oscillospiraceae bacterium]